MSSTSHYWRLLPLLIVANAIQTTWLSDVRLGTGNLNLVFGVALCAAMLGGPSIAFWVGIGAGYLNGLSAMWHPGSFLVAALVPCLIVGFLAARFETSHLLSPVLVAFFAVVVGNLCFVLMSPADFSMQFWISHTIYQSALQIALSWPLFWLVRRVTSPPKRLIWA
jgi:LytS/YehU family sensor histidine kinase